MLAEVGRPAVQSGGQCQSLAWRRPCRGPLEARAAQQRRGKRCLAVRAAAAAGGGGGGPSSSKDYAKYPEVYSPESTGGAPLQGEQQPARGLTGGLDAHHHRHHAHEPEYYQEEPPAGPLEAVLESRWGRGLTMGGAVFLGSTLAIAVFRTVQRTLSPRARSKRNINKNQLVVETLAGYLPNNRAGLTQGVLLKLKLLTGFSPTELFRKYLWFLLRERRFDEAAVADMVALRDTLQLNDTQVAEALRERAARIYERYGNVMLDVAGMTRAGVERKATCRALFSKLLYLAESEELLDQDSLAAKDLDIGAIFGALPDETSQLRIVSLQEVDFDKLESQFVPGQPPGEQPPPAV